MERISFVLRIDENDREEYIRRHKQVDSELLQAFREVGIRTYSIFLDGGGQLFAYMEVENYDQAMEQLSVHPANIHWQQFMSDLLKHHADGRVVREIPEVFYFGAREA